MNNKGLVAVGAVFLVLLLGWFATRDSQPKVGIKELKTAKIKADDVTKVEITIPPKPPKADGDGPAEPAKADGTPTVVVLEKSGSGFVVSSGSDKKFAVDDSQLKPLLDAIGEFQAGDVVANKAEKHKDFEIDDAQATHVVITTTAGKALDLLFGRAAKGGGTTVRQQGNDDVFVAKGRLGTLAKKELSGWRKKMLLDKKADDVTGVTLARADGTKIVLTAKTEDAPAGDVKDGEPPPPPKTTWTLTEPATLPAGFHVDEGALGREVASLVALRAVDFADGVDDATAGFSAAHDTVTATLKDGKSVVVHFGAVDDKKRVFAKVDGDPQVYLLADYAAKNVNKGLNDLRDLSLMPVKLDDVTQATFTAKGTKIVVKKDASGTWSLVEPKAAPAGFDPGQIGTVIGAVVRMKATRLAEGVSDAGASDVSVELVAGGKPHVIHFGAGVPDESTASKNPQATPKDVYVKGADGAVYVTSSYTKGRYEKLNDLFKKPPAPPPGMGGLGGGGMQGLDSLPPDVRKKLEASLKNQKGG